MILNLNEMHIKARKKTLKCNEMLNYKNNEFSAFLNWYAYLFSAVNFWLINNIAYIGEDSALIGRFSGKVNRKLFDWLTIFFNLNLFTRLIVDKMIFAVDRIVPFLLTYQTYWDFFYPSIIVTNY